MTRFSRAVSVRNDALTFRSGGKNARPAFMARSGLLRSQWLAVHDHLSAVSDLRPEDRAQRHITTRPGHPRQPDQVTRTHRQRQRTQRPRRELAHFHHRRAVLGLRGCATLA